MTEEEVKILIDAIYIISKNAQRQDAILEKQEEFFEREMQAHEKEKERMAKKSIRNKYLNIIGAVLALLGAYYSHDFFFDQYNRIISERDWFYSIFIESYNLTQAMELNRRFQIELSKYESQEQINDFIREQGIYFVRNKALESKHKAIEKRYGFTSAQMISHQIATDSIHRNNILEFVDTLK